MNLPRIRTPSIARDTEAARDLTFGITSLRMLFMSCLSDAGATSVAGRFLQLAAFTATSLLLQCFPLTTRVFNPSLRRNGQILSAILIRVFVQTGGEWALPHAGSIRVHLRYRLLVNLVPQGGTLCEDPLLHSLISPYKRASNYRRA